MGLILTSSCDDTLRKEMYKEIENQLKDIRSKKSKAKRVLLIVPASATLKTEEECFSYLGEEGFFDLLVMSGAKLRDEIQKECGYPDSTAITRIGRSLLLRKIIKDNKDEFSAFKKSTESQGFIDLAGDFLVQLKQNEDTLENLSKIYESAPNGSILKDKISDMQKVCIAYEAACKDKFFDTDDLLSFCIDKIPKSNYIKESIIWYLDFYSFTKHEYSFISALCENCIDFNCSILAGDGGLSVGKKTASKLASLSEKLSLKNIDSPKDYGPEKTYICECTSPYSRSFTIASDILKKVREEGLSYSDFVVLCGSEDAQESVKTVLSGLSIPVFFDTKRSVVHTALAQYIESALHIAEYGYRRRDVISLIKSGLFDETNQNLSLFENYIVQYKIFDKAFEKPLKYGKANFTSSDFEKLENIRVKLTDLLDAFKTNFSNAKTASQKTKVLYDFLTGSSNVYKSVLKLSKLLIEKGFVDSSEELSQSWDAIIEILNQLAEIAGDEELDNASYIEIFEKSISDVKIGVLPQIENAVKIGTITRTSFAPCNTLYIADCNDGIIPSDADKDLLLTKAELESLEEKDISLFKTSKTLAEEEMFQITRSLNTGCKHLVVMYTDCDKDANPTLPSPLISEIKEKLNSKNSDGEETKVWLNFNDISQDDNLLGYIQDSDMTISTLPYMLKKGFTDNIPEVWKQAYNILLDNEKCKTIAQSVFYKYGENNLGKSTVDRLLKKDKGEYFSPTELEKYASCPFKHFVSYNLRPDEQRVFEIDSANAGSIYHEILCKISDYLNEECKKLGLNPTAAGSPWRTITEEETEKLVEKLLKENENMLDGVMSSDAKNSYIANRIKESCIIYAKYMIKQVCKGNVSEMYFEQKFGEGLDFPAVEIETPFGNARIEGKIDRVDILDCDEEKYVKIIDYKSGNKAFSKEKAKNCLDLQLVVYLEGALGKDTDSKPAGIFYYLIHDPSNKIAMKDIFEGTIAGDLAQRLSDKISNNFALDGIVLNNEAVIKSLDCDVHFSKEGNPSSSVFKNSGTKRLVSEDEMNDLRASVKNGLKDLCSNIFEGKISPAPAFVNGKNFGCEFCNYAPICLYKIK